MLVIATVAEDKPHYNLEEAETLFEKFIQDYNRVYKDEHDRQIHYEAFVNSLKLINKLNEENSATYDINRFSDYTTEEFEQILGFHPEHKKDKENKK
ncbi:unnamed protein product [Colias eurytheme]|nr:unnamed protein product [Colias eurytheme]